MNLAVSFSIIVGGVRVDSGDLGGGCDGIGIYDGVGWGDFCSRIVGKGFPRRLTRTAS